MKTCKCGETDLSKFALHKYTTDGLSNICRKCDALRHKKYRENNIKKETIRSNKYKKNNLEKTKQTNKQYYEEHKERLLKYRCNRNKIASKNLTAAYIKKVIHKNIGIKYKDIPQDLIDLKRTQLQLKRAIKNEKT